MSSKRKASGTTSEVTIKAVFATVILSGYPRSFFISIPARPASELFGSARGQEAPLELVTGGRIPPVGQQPPSDVVIQTSSTPYHPNHLQDVRRDHRGRGDDGWPGRVLGHGGRRRGAEEPDHHPRPAPAPQHDDHLPAGPAGPPPEQVQLLRQAEPDGRVRVQQPGEST